MTEAPSKALLAQRTRVSDLLDRLWSAGVVPFLNGDVVKVWRYPTASPLPSLMAELAAHEADVRAVLAWGFYHPPETRCGEPKPVPKTKGRKP